ncbi:hypothetical protein AAC387_Pa11g0245 [Persea americana]
MMAPKRSPPREKDQAGCMWGLVCLFHFRNGRFTRRLISDRRHGSSRHAAGTRSSKRSVGLLTNNNDKCKKPDTSNGNLSDDGEIQIESIRISIKALLDEEMSKGPHSKNQSHLAAGDHPGRDHVQISKSCKVACDKESTVTGCGTLEARSSNERFPAKEELFHQNHQHSEMYVHNMDGTDSFQTQKTPISVESNEPEIQVLTKGAALEEKEVAMEAFLMQKFIDAKQLLGDESLIQSKEFMDALEIMNLNKDLFIKLMQDPNSVLVKHIQELRDAQSGVKQLDEERNDPVQFGEIVSIKQSRKQNIQSFFRRKDKAKCMKESDSAPASKEVFALKPGYASIPNSTYVTSPTSSPQSQFRLRNQVESETVPSYFSLREIKRKWKRVIGESRKEQHRISMDGILHRIPYGHRDHGDIGIEHENKASFSKERTSKPADSKKKDKTGKQKACESISKHEVELPSLGSYLSMYSHQHEANIYEEAKKHLAEMLNTGDEDGETPMKHIPRTLGRILSLPEYMSPRTSPRKDEEPSFPHEMIECSPIENFHCECENAEMGGEEAAAGHLSRLTLNVESSTLNDHKQSDGEEKLSNSRSGLLEGLPLDIEIQESICIEGDSTQKGGMEFEELTDVEWIEESSLATIPFELDSERPIADDHQSTSEAEKYEQEGYSECLKLESSKENLQQECQSDSFSGSPLHINKTEDPDSICEKAERPSPVSVLEPFCVEDVIDHNWTVAHQDELPMQPRRIHFEEQDDSAISITTSDPEIYPRTCMGEKESELDYIKVVLEASGLTSKEFMGRCHSSDQLLNLSMFEEVEAPSTQSSDNQKLLFDCINEVLMEVHERFYGCSPWVSFVKPNIQVMPLGKYVVREVWKGIDLHLLQKVPCKLDQTVGKDMEKDRRWMDLRFDVESIGMEIEYDILEELLEETTYDVLM